MIHTTGQVIREICEICGQNLHPKLQLLHFSLLLFLFTLFVDVYWCTLGERDAVSFVQRVEVDAVEADAEADGYDGAQKFAVLTRVECGRRQGVPSAERFLLVEGGQLTHLPDEVISGAQTEPCLQDAPHAEALMLRPQEAPRALQP